MEDSAYSAERYANHRARLLHAPADLFMPRALLYLKPGDGRRGGKSSRNEPRCVET
jgi:hypothetical protein